MSTDSNPLEKALDVYEKPRESDVQDDWSEAAESSKIKNRLMARFCVSTENDPLLSLNVGGKLLMTRRSTFLRIPNTILALSCVSPWSETFTRDDDGRLFFDCDPWAFEYLLNQLRVWLPSHKVFRLPKDNEERERFQNVCRQLHFDSHYTEGVERIEKFNKICGHILLEEKGFVARHVGTYRFAECRGMNTYSSGVHRIPLLLKHQKMETYNTFIGIIWSANPMQEKSFESPTAYGWAGQSRVYLKGILCPTIGYGGYDSDMCANDVIELILNCQLGFISLFNHRTKKTYEIQVDLQEGCPLPWQLHINLSGPEDRIKILNSN